MLQLIFSIVGSILRATAESSRAPSPALASPLRAALVLALVLASSAWMGCATRTAKTNVIERYGLTIDLKSEKRWLGGETLRGYQHPVAISAERLVHILSAAEVDMQKDDDSPIRERRGAIPAELAGGIAVGLAEALERAGPNQQVSVMALRKQAQHGIFNRKFLTSFTAYVQDERLHLIFSRIDWKTQDERSGVARGNRGRMPEPTPGQQQMRFRAVHNPLYQSSGPQGVAVDWRDPAFLEAVDLTGSTAGEGKRKDILAEEPIPADERPAEVPSAGELDGLSSAELRRLANLEDERAAGTLTELEYQNAREDILRGR